MEKNKNVPKLRFPEFTGEWEEKKLGEICDKIKDGTHFSPSSSNVGEYPYLTSKNVKNGYIDLTNIQYISKEDHEKIYKSCDVQFGDVLLTKDGTIGQVCVNELNYEFSLLSSVAYLRIDLNNINYFLYHILTSPYGQREIVKVIAGQALKRITLNKINDFVLSFPFKSEQAKIASFLTAVDEKLTQLKKKKTLLEQYKKGIMQKLFSQELRFKDDNNQDFPDWQEKTLGEVVKLQGGFAFKSEFFKKEGVPIIRISNISNENNYINTENIVFYKEMHNLDNFVIKLGDLIVAMSGATTGKSSIYNLPYNAYLNQRVGLFKAKTNLLFYSFLVQFVFSGNFKMQLDSVLVAGAQPNVSSTDIESFNFPFPSLPEQQKIATFLSAIDEKISHCSAQIEKMEAWKKGLLQQMFC